MLIVNCGDLRESGFINDTHCYKAVSLPELCGEVVSRNCHAIEVQDGRAVQVFKVDSGQSRVALSTE